MRNHRNRRKKFDEPIGILRWQPGPRSHHEASKVAPPAHAASHSVMQELDPLNVALCILAPMFPNGLVVAGMDATGTVNVVQSGEREEMLNIMAASLLKISDRLSGENSAHDCKTHRDERHEFFTNLAELVDSIAAQTDDHNSEMSKPMSLEIMPPF